MSTDSISPPSRSSSPAAQRMRRYRKQRRRGLRSVRILLDETDIDALIRMRLLKEDHIWMPVTRLPPSELKDTTTLH
jgi:hypothetical protein